MTGWTDSIRLAYDLGRKVPDMQQRGLRIETASGEIDVPPGPLADAIAAAVANHLRHQLAAVEAEALS